MKHGDKAKAKTAKAASKTSAKRGKASPPKAGSKAGTNLKSSKHPDRSKSLPAKTSSSKPAGGNGQVRNREVADSSGFSNPLVASAFKRALKKFFTAFRRLTD
jgi:hypothetical protein